MTEPRQDDAPKRPPGLFDVIADAIDAARLRGIAHGSATLARFIVQELRVGGYRIEGFDGLAELEWAVEKRGADTTWTSRPFHRREHAERELRDGASVAAGPQRVVCRDVLAGPWREPTVADDPPPRTVVRRYLPVGP